MTTSLNAQEIPLGTMFTIDFKNPIENMDFEIIETNPYNQSIDIQNINSIINKNKIKDNQMIGVFASGKFSTQDSPLLILYSKLPIDVEYALKIKLPNKKKFKTTSTSPLAQNIMSIEQWPYPVEKIYFKKFKTLPESFVQSLYIEEKIDSACIKHADKNIEEGQKEFKSHLASVIRSFESNDKFELKTLIEYEKSINSQDASLGHSWYLSKGIYPDENNFNFGIPISYRRVECPYFDILLSYFYTKENHDVKVVSFEWKVFKESNLSMNPENKYDGSGIFRNKHDFIVESLSQFLGTPLNIPQEEDSGRFDTHWESPKGVRAYLFMFKNFNEIRLYLYKN
ncbi:MAG: hypothetical protein ACLGH8_02045 [Bacteroidia bacterium]